jgi:hypothetical protein
VDLLQVFTHVFRFYNSNNYKNYKLTDILATDILNDIDTTLITPSLTGVTFPSGVQIINGVYSPWSSVHDQVIQEVAALIEQYPDYTLESTGHSLGGALTYLSYIALTQNFPGKNVTSNALAAFPIGNSAFAAFGTAQSGLLRRGNNVDDGVPVRFSLLSVREC